MKTFTLLLNFLTLCMGLSLAQNNAPIYGLNFTTGQLKMASLDPNTGTVQLLNTSPLSPDLFGQGVSDLDPIGRKYYYVRSGQIITADIDSGTVISSPTLSNPNNAIAPITNIAYNWLNDTIYGLNFKGNQLRLASVNPANGQVNIISSSVISPDQFSQGDADIDPVHRRYFYVRAQGELITVDLDNGQALHKTNIQFPAGSQNDFFMNMTYNWLNDTLYGLYFQTGYYTSGTCQGALFLASVDIANGQLNILSQNPLSRDCFGQAVCDIDPVRRRYYYVRQDPVRGAELITASLDDGRLLSRITLSDPDPNGSIVPITNIAVNELFALPNSRISMNMGGTASMTPGQQMQLNAYVGPQASYLWQDGSTQPIMNVSAPGTYSVEINRQGFDIRGEVTVTATDIEEALLPGNMNAFPNPFQDVLRITWSGEQNRPIQYNLRDALGKVVREGKIMGETSISTRDLSKGGYVLQLTDGSRSQYKLVIKQ